VLLMDIYTPAVQVGEIPAVERVMIFGDELVEERVAVACCHEDKILFQTESIF
jgi:hypothetical protein